jgi:hypothetical protein
MMRAAVTILVLVTACTEYVARDPGIDAVSHVEDRDWPAADVWKLDLLFVIDDTAAMASYQDRIAELPAHVERLLDGAHRTTNARIAVTTNGGVLRTVPGMTEPFLSVWSDYDLTRFTSFEGAFSDVFATLLNVGFEGAGPSQPLAAADVVLDDESTGFLRDNAPLGIIFVTASDDASVYPPRDYERYFKSLKADPARVFVSAIVGEQTPRLDEMLAAFVNRNVRAPLDGDYAPAVERLAQLKWSTLGQPYLYASDVDVETPGPQYECTFTASYDGIQHALPQCSDDGDLFCWTLQPDPHCMTPNCVVPKIPPYTISHFQPDVRAQCVVLH